MPSVQRPRQLCWILLLIGLTKATEYYGPPKYGPPKYGYEPPKYEPPRYEYEPPKYEPSKYKYEPPKYGYGYKPYKKPQTGLSSVLKSPDIFTIVAGDKKTTTETPIELHINLTFPENGIPPTKLRLGNVAGYLSQRPDGPKPSKHTVLVDLQNQNRPFRPIPVDVYQAGLPQGSLLPPDKAADCKRFINETCNSKCSAISRGCSPLCRNASSCLATCDRASKTCTSACNSVKDNVLFKGMEGGKIGEQAKLVLFTKCLRNCKTNGACIAKCNRVCKDEVMVDKNPSSRQYYRQMPGLALPGLDQLNVQGLLEGFSSALDTGNLPTDFSELIPAVMGIFENNPGILSQALPFDIAAITSREEDVESILNADVERADEDYPSDVAVDFF